MGSGEGLPVQNFLLKKEQYSNSYMHKKWQTASFLGTG